MSFAPLRSGARRLLETIALALMVSAGVAVRADAQPLVAAASSLRLALAEVVAEYEYRGGVAPRVSYGSSGNFYRQIRQGAPYELLLSADEEYVFELAREGHTRDNGAVYAVGRVVLLIPRHSPLEVDPTLANLAAALSDGRLGRFAIANPAHAPYGRAAREALEHRGIWNTIRERLLFGENASQATQFALSANADGGIVPLSLALSRDASARAQFALLPQEWHRPIAQRMVLLKRASGDAKRFYDFLLSADAATALEQFGFSPPAPASQ